jgi:O-acetyl-ADP-ribose deacetylase (regulator of RNase III)
MKVSTLLGDITSLASDYDAIVNAANAWGVMGAGVAGAIARAGGSTIVQEASNLCKKTHFEPGDAYVTGSGNLKQKHVIHAVTMRAPGTSYRMEKHKGIVIVEQCVKSIIKAAKELNLKKIAIPGLATGVGGLRDSDVAFTITDTLNSLIFEDIEVVICDIDKSFIEYCEVFLDEQKNIGNI